MMSERKDAVVHDSVRAYEQVAVAYEHGRPGYPEAVLERLVARAGIGPGSVVVDLAAGTGKLTRQLLRTGAAVSAVEPVAAFREELRRLPVPVVDGVAEAIPIVSGSVDLVTVAAAFHWFDAPRALAEIHRILRPGGALAVVWNERSHDDPTQRALTELIEPYRRGEPRQSDEAWLGAFETAAGFAALEREDFPYLQSFTPESLVERVESISFIAALDGRDRSALLERVRGLTSALRGPSFQLPHITHLYTTKRLDGANARAQVGGT
jgi:SAM-dependent methyltransferase